MACSCKQKSANRQVTSVKRVVKKPLNMKATNPAPQKKITKRIIFKRHI